MDLFDVAGRGITAIVPTAADATTLPFPDASFDAAYLVTVLGEIPDPARAVGELGRAQTRRAADRRRVRCLISSCGDTSPHARC
jgi:ubiquinone/menaquinone biosynthesis C-methylase UbiE